MLNRTGSVNNWRANVGFRRATASMLARRYASQGWPSETMERTGQTVAMDTATGTGSRAGEDAFTRVHGGAARARQAIQKAIASILNIDTSRMGGDDEGKFIDAIDSLADPAQAVRALNTLDRLSARHASVLPQVRHAVDRIQRHLEPLLNKIRVDV